MWIMWMFRMMVSESTKRGVGVREGGWFEGRGGGGREIKILARGKNMKEMKRRVVLELEPSVVNNPAENV
jgi:hypothetical protein